MKQFNDGYTVALVKPLHSLATIFVAESQKKISTKKTLAQRLQMMAVQAVPCRQQLPSKVNQIHFFATTAEYQFLDLDHRLLQDKKEALV